MPYVEFADIYTDLKSSVLEMDTNSLYEYL